MEAFDKLYILKNFESQIDELHWKISVNMKSMYILRNTIALKLEFIKRLDTKTKKAERLPLPLYIQKVEHHRNKHQTVINVA